MTLTYNQVQSDVLRHLKSTLGKDAPNASVFDWRMALSFAIRDRIVEPWFASTRRTWAEDRKRVYYLSMEFLIGRLLEDATVNLGLRDTVIDVMAGLWPGFPGAWSRMSRMRRWAMAGLGRLAACFMESMATVGCPAYGYGIRYEHGLFRQQFTNRHAGRNAGGLAAAPQPVGVRAARERPIPSGSRAMCRSSTGASNGCRGNRFLPRPMTRR